MVFCGRHDKILYPGPASLTASPREAARQDIAEPQEWIPEQEPPLHLLLASTWESRIAVSAGPREFPRPPLNPQFPPCVMVHSQLMKPCVSSPGGEEVVSCKILEAPSLRISVEGHPFHRGDQSHSLTLRTLGITHIVSHVTLLGGQGCLMAGVQLFDG